MLYVLMIIMIFLLNDPLYHCTTSDIFHISTVTLKNRGTHQTYFITGMEHYEFELPLETTEATEVSFSCIIEHLKRSEKGLISVNLQKLNKKV